MLLIAHWAALTRSRVITKVLDPDSMQTFFNFIQNLAIQLSTGSMMKFIKVKELKPKTKTDNAELENPSFHNSVGPALFAAQFFGAMPVCGVLAKDEDSVKFKWLSINTIYSMFFLFCGTIESSLGTWRLLRLGFNVHFAEGLMFFITAMIRAFMFFKLAREWKTIIKYWRKCEEPFLSYPYEVRGWSLKKTLRVVFFFLVSLSISNKCH